MMRLTHIRLLVADYLACFRFYRDVMGLAVAWGDENGPYAGPPRPKRWTGAP
jgi:catechol 2,3-dioxygenase-like lactoylglutathione lyase family enzyme